MEKLELPAVMYQPEEIGTEGMNWYEVKFEGCETIYTHGLKRDKDLGYWVELRADSKVVSYLIEKKCMEWSTMPVKLPTPKEEKTFEPEGKKDNKVEVKLSDLIKKKK